MLFFSSYHNRIDKKGRISVPASFRAVLGKQGFSGIIVYQSLRNPCLEACGMQRFEKMNARIEEMDPFSPERDALADTLFGQSVQLSCDGEGRVMLPEKLREASELENEAIFVGKGEIFEIWEPKTYEAYSREARKHVKKQYGALVSKDKS